MMQIHFRKKMKTKKLTFLLALTILFLMQPRMEKLE